MPSESARRASNDSLKAASDWFVKIPFEKFRFLHTLHARRRSLNGWLADPYARIALRQHSAPRPLVDRNSTSGPCTRWFRRLCHAARLRRQVLRVGPVPLAFLFAAHRSPASLVATLTGASHSCWPAGLSRHVLLLPQSLLPRIFPGSARLCSRRIPSPHLSRRNSFSFYPAKCPSLFLLPCGSVHHFSLVRRHSLLLLRRPFRRRRRHARPHSQRYSSFALHVFLPFASPPRRRQARLLFLRNTRPLPLRSLAPFHVSERAPHALRVVQSLLCRLCGLLRPHGLLRCHP